MSESLIEQIKVLDHGYVRLLSHHGSDREIVRHARTSTGGGNKTETEDKRLLFYLYKNRHTSPFEMARFWFEVSCPIFVFRQWIRHRTMSVNEVSARYYEMPDVFYVPKEWRKQAEKNKQSSEPSSELNHEQMTQYLKYTCNQAYANYGSLLAHGVSREMARMVLPVNLYTKVHLCVDLHNLLGFLRLRDDAHAQAEIQEYARAIKTLITPHFPWTMEAYQRFPVVVLDSETQVIKNKYD